MKKFFTSILLSLLATGAFSQEFPERRLIRQGNREFGKENFQDSEVSYLRALQKDSSSYEAGFNLSGAMYKQGRFEEAEKRFDRLSSIEADSMTRSSAYFNLGNSLFGQKKYKEALEAFKNSMRYNPADTEAKFNYAYTKKMLENEENKDNQDNQDNQDDENQQQQQNQDRNNDNPDNQNQDQNNDNRQDQQQPQGGGMSREEAERMLEAIQNSEDNTREKVDAQEAQGASRSTKNW